MEMEAVADIFDGDNDGYINYKEFVAALRPDRAEVLRFDSNSKLLIPVLRQLFKDKFSWN